VLELPPRRPRGRGEPLAALSPERFAGTGEIRAVCRTRKGVDFPERWTLELAPARALIGSEHAEERRLELDGATREALLTDLPLAGYELRASAPEMSAEPVLLLLSAPHHTALSAELLLEPAGIVVGLVVDPDGDPVEGLELWLERTGGAWTSGATPTPGLHVRTNALGAYRFEGVLNGEYGLHVGPPGAPLRDPIEIGFQSPTLTMRPIEVPALCALEVRVYDAAGLVVEDALLQGWCASGGGRIEGRTDVFGRYGARHVPPGEYTVIATHERLGSTRGRVQLAPDEPAELELSFRP
jgi:hypothetical protein